MTHKPCHLFGSGNIKAPGKLHGLVCYDSHGAPLNAGVPDHGVRGVQRLHLKEMPVIHHRLDNSPHIVGLVCGVGDEGI